MHLSNLLCSTNFLPPNRLARKPLSPVWHELSLISSPVTILGPPVSPRSRKMRLTWKSGLLFCYGFLYTSKNNEGHSVWHLILSSMDRGYKLQIRSDFCYGNIQTQPRFLRACPSSSSSFPLLSGAMCMTRAGAAIPRTIGTCALPTTRGGGGGGGGGA